MSPDFYTVAEAAEAAGVSTKTIRNHIAKNYLKAYRRGPRNLIIRLDDFDNYFRPYGKSYLRKF